MIKGSMLELDLLVSIIAAVILKAVVIAVMENVGQLMDAIAGRV